MRWAFYVLLIVIGSSVFDFIGWRIAGLAGISYGRWIFYGLTAAFLILLKDIGLGFSRPRFNKLTILLSALIVFSLPLYWLLLSLPGAPTVPTDRSWSDLFILAIWCPILEELVFRQAMQQSLLKHYSKIVVFLAVSILFALYHPGFLLIFEALGILPVHLGVPNSYVNFLVYQTPDAFIAGIIFSLLRQSSGSTLYCIFLHGLFNFFLFSFPQSS